MFKRATVEISARLLVLSAACGSAACSSATTDGAHGPLADDAAVARGGDAATPRDAARDAERHDGATEVGDGGAGRCGAAVSGEMSCAVADAGASTHTDAGTSADGGGTTRQGDSGTSTAARVAALVASPYPRLGSYLIGGSPRSYYDPSFIAWASKQQVVIMGIWDGWEKDYNASMQSTIDAIHSQSPLATPPVAILYSDFYDRQEGLTSGEAYYPVQVAMNANNWWLRSSFPSGPILGDATWSLSDGIGNQIAGGPMDSEGRDYVHYSVQFDDDMQVGGGNAGLALRGNGPDDAVDGFYHDVLWAETMQPGDWQRTGTSDATGNGADSAALRQGEATALTYRATLNPGKLVTGNLVAFAGPGTITTELQGIMQGGVLEGMIGESSAAKTFQAMMAAYQKQMNMLAPPALGIFGHDFVATNGSDQTTATPYQAMRYGLGATLLGDAYYFPNVDGWDGYDCNNHLWFDEFDNAGAGVGYLGQSLGGPVYTTAWQKGVFRRDFEHGIVLVNPVGNGAQTVTLEKAYVHIRGSQDASVNDGSSVTSVSLADRDGVILLD
jgi:Hypothetical glycosyl hydrolase family 15